jgi:hypothetical protein
MLERVPEGELAPRGRSKLAAAEVEHHHLAAPVAQAPGLPGGIRQLDLRRRIAIHQFEHFVSLASGRNSSASLFTADALLSLQASEMNAERSAHLETSE